MKALAGLDLVLKEVNFLLNTLKRFCILYSEGRLGCKYLKPLKIIVVKRPAVSFVKNFQNADAPVLYPHRYG